MFTGIVEELGEVAGVEHHGDAARLTIRGSTEGVARGDSIAVNGVCLTVTGILDGTFTADVMGETLSRSGLGALAPGDPVNLERSVRLADRLGGHLVQGHVDATAHDHLPDASRTLGQVRITLPAGSPGTWWRRARSRSTASASPSPRSRPPGDAARRLVRGQPDPRDAQAHHAGDRQPGDS